RAAHNINHHAPRHQMTADAPGFKQWLVAQGLATNTNPNPTPTTQPGPVAAAGTNPRYVNAAVDRELLALASAAEGSRNDTLNEVAFNLRRFVDSGDIDEQTVLTELRTLAASIGLDHREIEATIKSAFRGSQAKVGAAVVPEALELGEVYTLEVENRPLVAEAASGGGVHADSVATGTGSNPNGTPTPDEARTLLVNRRVYELRINDEAQQAFRAWQATQLGQERPHPVPLPDMLAVPDEDATYRIIDLLPTGGNVLLAAQQKAGKTSMIANLLRAIADGGSFLGKFPAAPVNRVTLIDNELDERMLRRWLREQDIANADAVHVVSLKGRIATFDINNAAVRAQWADDLRGSDFVILDCLRPCLDALGLSEDKDAGKFLVSWDALKKEAGVDETVVVHHMGHSQERSRGDSRLLDWPDVNWKIIKEAQSEDANPEDVGADGGKRFFAAHGRDVMVPEGLLQWNPQGRSLTYLNGGRRDRKTLDGVSAIVEILSDGTAPDGLNKSEMKTRLMAAGMGRNDAERAITRALEDNIVYASAGARNARTLNLNPSARTQ
ncbi:AAA family ATPase, partial [Mycolicibacterium fortuitum]